MSLLGGRRAPHATSDGPGLQEALVAWAAWGIAAVLWLGVHAFDFILRRARKDNGNVAASGMQAFGMLFKMLGLLVVLFAAASSSPRLALAAALVYALAYTLELGLSLVTYFGNTP